MSVSSAGSSEYATPPSSPPPEGNETTAATSAVSQKVLKELPKGWEEQIGETHPVKYLLGPKGRIPVKAVTIERKRGGFEKAGLIASKILPTLLTFGSNWTNKHAIRDFKKNWNAEVRTVYTDKFDRAEKANLEKTIKASTSLKSVDGTKSYNVRYKEDMAAFARDRYENKRSEFVEIPGKGLLWTDPGHKGRFILVPYKGGGDPQFEDASSFIARDAETGELLEGTELMRTAAQYLILQSAISEGLKPALKKNMEHLFTDQSIKNQMVNYSKELAILCGIDEELNRITTELNKATDESKQKLFAEHLEKLTEMQNNSTIEPEGDLGAAETEEEAEWIKSEIRGLIDARYSAWEEEDGKFFISPQARSREGEIKLVNEDGSLVASTALDGASPEQIKWVKQYEHAIRTKDLDEADHALDKLFHSYTTDENGKIVPVDVKNGPIFRSIESCKARMQRAVEQFKPTSFLLNPHEWKSAPILKAGMSGPQWDEKLGHYVFPQNLLNEGVGFKIKLNSKVKKELKETTTSEFADKLKRLPEPLKDKEREQTTKMVSPGPKPEGESPLSGLM
ncbi:MAG: hypothetical protein S4CHLAM45_00170 [Chlamydiales bacterium]|nr:hypothetical protein [Chlamydiales bacterium]MCH9619342.1 hypothetical protein [Chlamydiales bacterium]MCH9622146.1 hypothetical protein [Chlamydiales bacterium]